jgi:hypothetical protein
MLFALLATANAAGYRYGVSDQAFYVPAVELAAHPGLFPRDRAALEPQMRLWLGDSVMGWTARLAGGDLPTLFVILHVLTLATLFFGAVALARRLGADWWTVGAFLALLTFRHQITRTGANSLEGYMHPRMLAFALGMAALGGLAGRRYRAALLWTAAAAAVHTTTALWFGVVVFVALAWGRPARQAWGLIAGGAAVAASVVLGSDAFSSRLVPMDQTWLDALGERSYLFSGSWPAYAWVVNLAYPVVLAAIFRRRQNAGVIAAGERGLMAGLLALVALFALSVPLTEYRIALAVQMQVNRVFWLLDAAAAFYIAWWLLHDLGRTWRPAARLALMTVLIAASACRGYYVLQVAARPLVEISLPSTSWTEAMTWLRGQPATWHVLADPQHAWRYGSSVRVAAARDTLLEAGKDPALAIYDRELALRVSDRTAALADFDALTGDDVRGLAFRYALDVFVDRAERRFDFPVLYRNDEFVVYDIR